MDKLSYSAHLSNGDHAIDSKAKLSDVAKHNFRKYHSKDYNKDNIVVLCGTDKLMEDVKKIYKEQFDEAVKNTIRNRPEMTERLMIILKRSVTAKIKILL